LRFLRSLTGKGRDDDGEAGEASESAPVAGQPAVAATTPAAGSTAATGSPAVAATTPAAGQPGASGAGAPVRDDQDDLPDDELAREGRLERDFQAGLSDLARRQLQYAEYSLKPPSQVIRTGTWILTEPTEGRDTAGRSVPLDARTPLVFIDAEPPVLRFRTADGREVDLDVEPDESWPAFLVRESDLEP
jgi:hypothetical protein